MQTKYGYLILLLIILAPLYGHTQDLIWSVNYGGKYNEEGNSGLLTLDNNFVVLGSTFSDGSGEFDFYLLKINSAGGALWSKTYGGTEAEYGYDIQETDDGGFVMVGSTQSYGEGNSDIYLVRVDSVGEILFSQTYGGEEDDEARSVRITSDGGFIICGTTNSYGAGYSDLYLVRTNASGDTLWTRTFGGAGGESGFAVRQTADGGYIAVGSTGSFGTGYSSVYVVRLDADGDSLWAEIFGGDRADFGSSVEITYDGGFLITGWTASYGAGFYDVYLIKTDSDGNFEWQQTYGGPNEDRAYSIFQAMDGGYIISGTKEGNGAQLLDVYVIKTDPAGNLIWDETYGGAKSDFGMIIFQEPGRDYMLVGHTYSYSAGGSDVYIMKLQGEATAAPDDEPASIPSGFELAQNYPNPFNSSTIISFTIPVRSDATLTVYNILGQAVREWDYQFIPAGNYSVQWDGRNNYGMETASGVYFYRLSAGEYVETKKMVLIK